MITIEQIKNQTLKDKLNILKNLLKSDNYTDNELLNLLKESQELAYLKASSNFIQQQGYYIHFAFIKLNSIDLNFYIAINRRTENQKENITSDSRTDKNGTQQNQQNNTSNFNKPTNCYISNTSDNSSQEQEILFFLIDENLILDTSKKGTN